MPRSKGKGRIAAFEVLVGTTAIKNLIRQNQVAQIGSYMFMGAQYGMQTLEQSLVDLVERGLVSRDESFARANDRSIFEKVLAPGT